MAGTELESGPEETDVTTTQTRTGAAGKKTIEPNAQNLYEVTRADMPLHCPLPGMSLWNSHPRVFLPIEDSGKAMCPYCGATYVLVDRGGV